tara:strand:- start:269 stop:1240 length:972 start_codon:yes stop_codon:yes gene_type:complete
MKNNIIIYVSSRNNYDMLEGEVLKNIKREGFEFINVDDKSCDEEITKGKAICEDHGIVFLENKSRGVQMATQTLVDYINEHRPDCKWIICFQHDHYPISDDFFSIISERVDNNILDDFGIIGFNVLDKGAYTGNAYNDYLNGEKPIGMIGMCHLSVHSREGRWLCPKQQGTLLEHMSFGETPFIVEFPMWASVGISVDKWNKYIKPTTDYQFHLWLPDVAMQFNYNNIPCLILPDLYTLNDQQLKVKYGIDASSAPGSRRGNEYHFGKYSNFDAWMNRWGWYYEDIVEGFEQVKDNYKNTLIWDYYHHDITKGPLRRYEKLYT